MIVMEKQNVKNHEVTPEGKIHVMPAFFRNAKDGRVLAQIETAAAPVAPSAISVKVEKKVSPKKNKLLTIGAIIVAVLLVGGSAYLLYLSAQPVQTTIDVVPPPVIETPQIVETPIDVVEPQVQPEEEIAPPEPFKPEKLSEEKLAEATSEDSDGDGLTDLEEIVFSTNPTNADSDKDGYNDGTEVLNLYNPQGTAPVKLEFTNFIKVYTNDLLGFSFFHPESWLASLGAINDNEMILMSEKGDFINVFTVEKPVAQSLVGWYASMVPTLTADEITQFLDNKYDVNGIVSPDGFTYYFDRGEVVIVVHYNVGKTLEVNYPTVLKMIANSFHFTE
jgi:hypothetical protein